MPESPSKEPLVWIDCEMTGLDFDNDTILQIACYVTDYDLNLLDEEGFEVVIHHEKEVLDKMNDWCIEHHAATGLTQKCIESTVTHEEAAERLLAYVKKYAPTPKKALLAGNTVYADQRFLEKPPYRGLVKHLHHRIMDVSAIKEAARRWAPKAVIKGSPRKKGLHEARQDILESIAEAAYYRDVFFRPSVLPTPPESGKPVEAKAEPKGSNTEPTESSKNQLKKELKRQQRREQRAEARAAARAERDLEAPADPAVESADIETAQQSTI